MTYDSAAQIPEGWYRDPSGAALERYFDGATWTQQTRETMLRPRADRQRVDTAPEHVPQLAFAASPYDQAPVPGYAPPAAAASTSPFPVPGAPASAGAAPAEQAHRTGAARRSLSEALGGGVSPLSAQRLLIGTTAATPSRAMASTQGVSASGWYPDPARGGGLRFFDGTRWTSRIRPRVDDSPRRLPAAALKLRARFLEAQDAAAIKRGPRVHRERLVIPRAASAPSLRTRSRSGSMWGMLSTLLMAIGLIAAAVFAWQLWGTNFENKFQQEHLEKQLSSHKVQDGSFGGVPVTTVTVTVPTTGADPQAIPTDEPSSATDTGSSPGHGSIPSPGRPDASAGTHHTGAGTATGTGAGTGTGTGTGTGGTGTSSGGAGGSSTSVTQVHVDPAASGDGRPVGHIRIPAIGLDRVFVLGTGEDQLALGPGLWKWGSFPGTPGNTTISGHRTTHGAPFYRLGDLKYGDKIYIDVPGQPQAVYEVRGHTISSPLDVRITQQTAGVRLTLTTCNPVGSASQRLVIEAELIKGKYLDEALPRNHWKLLK